jgi:hypothetical protein
VFGKWDVDLQSDWKAPNYIINFYGFGNDTKLLPDEKAFYRIRATSFLFKPGVSRSWNNNVFNTAFIFNSVKVNQTKDKFINQPLAGIDSGIYKAKYFSGAAISWKHSTVNDLKYPTKGIIYEVGSTYLINIKDAKRDFINGQTSFTFYTSPVENLTIAHRSGISTNIGDFEFYQANTLGGMDNLRGYWRTRFSGRSCFYQNTDLRLKLAELKGYVFRGSLGIYGFFDDGRVWIKDDRSNKIHIGYGGGIYFIPYNTLAINISYASSSEANVVTVRSGFLF